MTVCARVHVLNRLQKLEVAVVLTRKLAMREKPTNVNRHRAWNRDDRGPQRKRKSVVLARVRDLTQASKPEVVETVMMYRRRLVVKEIRLNGSLHLAWNSSVRAPTRARKPEVVAWPWRRLAVIVKQNGNSRRLA